jgi:hypothetical protein
VGDLARVFQDEPPSLLSLRPDCPPPVATVVGGSDLTQRLAAELRIPIPDVVRVAEAVARGPARSTERG